MPWPPETGEPLPNAESAYNVYEKLGTYSLDLDHDVGGYYARALLEILGVGIEDIHYLALSLLEGFWSVP